MEGIWRECVFCVEKQVGAGRGRKMFPLSRCIDLPHNIYENILQIYPL